MSLPRVFLALAGLSLLSLPGCLTPPTNDSAGEPATEDPTPTPTGGEPTPSPSPTPSPDARISNLHLWKDGCSVELWGRWQSGDDYAIDAFQVRTEAGDLIASVTYAELTFRGGMDEVWRFFDAIPFPETRYRVLFLFGDGSEHEETIDLDADLFAGPTLLGAGNVLADGPGGGLAVYVDSQISGSVQRVMVYDASSCRVHWKVFYSEPQLSPGTTTRLDVGGAFSSGEELVVTVEGVDDAANYTYYTSVHVTVP